ncbi:MAG: hypothetical protein PHQ23_16495, partial [Candidatus Wallbacteria bacterium]|nr:hypothetical protein [Candidatus Wallbacteria bacterium]
MLKRFNFLAGAFLAAMLSLSAHPCFSQEESKEEIHYFPHCEMRDIDPVTVFRYVDGEKIAFDGAESALKFTRVWLIGDPSNITAVYFLIHGDGASDYSDSTASDRKAMSARIRSGEGAVIAYPVSSNGHWPYFEGGKNGNLLLKMFRQIENATGKSGLRFEQFALSGGGRVNHALLRLILSGYDTDQDVKSFVDNNLRGIHDGDSLCYNIAAMKNRYIEVIRKFQQVSFCFIHNTSGQMSYVHTHHNDIAKSTGNEGYAFGKSLSL